MLQDKGFEEAIILALNKINGSQSPWAGSINGHNHMLHFHMWKIFNDEIQVFHIHSKDCPWNEFTKDCTTFAEKNNYRLSVLLQDRQVVHKLPLNN